MSIDEPPGGSGLLLPRGARSRSYGSLVRSPGSTTTTAAAPRGGVPHTVEPGDTLPGLALKYGVSVLLIPAAPLAGSEACGCLDLVKEGDLGEPSGRVCAPGDGDKGLSATAEVDSSELSPMDFLKRMDALIRQSKKVAVQGCHDGEKRFAAIEAACNIKVPEHRCLTHSQSVAPTPALSQQTSLTAVPLTVTKRTKTIRASEDELFQL
ncbi:hypothetical protein CRUP_033971 [Coryphaenoides rupestris]|nr:hypothetical protein CRUP_033971 [Coryphaenoides rupestris]